MSANTALTLLYVINQHFLLIFSTEIVSFFIRYLYNNALSGSIPDMSANTALTLLYVKSTFIFSSCTETISFFTKISPGQLPHWG